jgi:hypothetical protein
MLNARNIVTTRKKKNAYTMLLDKYRNRYREANREDVTKKLSSLRTNFRKEIKIDNSGKKMAQVQKVFFFSLLF